MPLPNNGDLNWGTPLNADIEADESNISLLTTSVSEHEANVPPDPHGDRAFTSGLVTPITTGLNLPPAPGVSLGLVQLGANGKIPLSLVPVGAGLTNWIDAIPDFNVNTTGAPTATQINAALTAANANGGGIVYIGNGQFGLDQPLIIYQNTWLLCSPGAIFYRITTTTPPTAMVQNYAFNVAPIGGNIRITGGYWDVANITPTGTAFSFVNTTAVLIEDMIVVANNDGLSSVSEIFGCTNVVYDNVSVYASAPQTTGRSNQHIPCFRVEECNSSNKPSLPNSCYGNQECQNVVVRNCNLTPQGIWPSDSFGAYSCFTSFCGTKGTVQNGSRHININIVEGCYASALALAGIECNNWQNTTVTGCDFNQPQTPYLTTIDGVAPGTPLYFLYDINSPAVLTPNITNITVTNTIVETIVNQFTINANDWIPGNTCYRHHHGGFLTCPASATLTIKIYVGILGTTGDTLTETFTITFANAHNNDPYCYHHKGFDCDSSGSWNHCGSEYFCGSSVSGHDEHFFHCGDTNPSPTKGKPVYVTHTATWDSANSNRTCLSAHGNHERRKQ